MKMEKIKLKRKTGRSILRAPAARDLPLSAALFLVARASVMGTFAPGFAFFAAICDVRAAYIYLPVLLLGSLSAGANTVKYFLASLLFWIISEFRLREAHRLTNALYCGGLVIICGLFSALAAKNALAQITLLLIEGILSGVLCYTYSDIAVFLSRERTARRVTQEETISFVLLICSALLGLAGINLPLNINIAQFAAIYLILCAVLHLSLPRALCFAAAVGFASVSDTADAVTMMGIMTLASLFSSFIKKYGKYALVTGFFAGVAVALLYISDAYALPISLIPLFFSSAMFLLTPTALQNKMKSFLLIALGDGTPESDIKIKKYIARELKELSAAFKKLSSRLISTSEATAYNSRAAAAMLFDEVSERVCQGCASYDECWRKNLNDTCRQMFMIIDIMESEGYCDMTNLPIVFSQKCRRRESFICEFNHTYEMRKQNSIRQAEAAASRDLVARQYAEISSVIADISNEVEYGFYFSKDAEDNLCRLLLDEKISPIEVKVIENTTHKPEVYLTLASRIGAERLKNLVSSAVNFPMRLADDYAEGYHLITDNLYYPEISVCRRTKDGQSVSGDTVLHFEAPANKYCVILCDGMGSGEDASTESKMTAELLREFITAGIKTETAIKIINSSLALKTRREGFSTADLAEIDLISGGITMHKAGSAQTFIKMKNEFETVTAKNLPLGIVEDITVSRAQKNFKPGDIAVMISDGVSEADYGAMRGEWMKKIISDTTLTTNEISAAIIQDALKKNFPNSPDDMTVIVIKLCKY